MKTILLNDTSNEYHLGSELVIRTLRKYCKQYNFEIIKTFSRLSIIQENSDIFEKVKEAELIIINGEGSIHHNVLFFKLFLKAVPANKKIVLINTVWEGMDSPGIIKNLYKINLISVRESESYNQLIKIVDPNKVLITPDLIFDTTIQKYDIGYSDTVLHNLKSKLQNQANYFPLSFIAKGTYLKPEVIEMPDILAYLNWLKSLNLFVTGRFHGVCLALLTQTNFLALPSNSHKIEGILKDMNCQDLLISNLKEVDSKKEIVGNYTKEKLEYVNNAKIKIPELFKRISEL